MAHQIGIIGYPLGHTLSPVFQQAALDHLKIDARFEAWPVAPEDLSQKVATFRSADVLGSCVTLPHKQTVIPMLDEVDEVAAAIGAVNWIVNRGGRLHGYNTDAAGFLRALREAAGFDPAGERALVFGAGGAARAVVYALRGAGAGAVTISNRTRARAETLAVEMTQGRFRPAATGMTEDELADVAPYARLIVNTTSMGMSGGPAAAQTPLTAELIPADALGFDAVYAPPLTPFLREVERAGARAATGLSMLVYQGAEGFRLCTGREAPGDIMMAATESAVRGA